MAIYNGIIKEIDQGELRRYAGLNKLQDNSLDEHLQAAAKKARLLIRPGGVYQRYGYDQNSCTILAPKPMVLKDKSIIKHLAKSQEVYLLAVTVGKDIEEASSAAFAEGNYTEGVLLDAAGTTAVEQVADQLNDYLKQQAAKAGYTTTWRFSPGYGDWSLEAQEEVLALAQGNKIGISTTSSLMLNPQKSVTAIIGLMPKGESVPGQRGCRSCTMKNCSSRKV